MPFLINNRRRHFQPEAHEGDWDFAQGDVPSSLDWTQISFGTGMDMHAICPKHGGDGVVVLTDSTTASYINAYLEAGTCAGLALDLYSKTSRANNNGTDLRFDVGALCTRDGLKFLLQAKDSSTTLCMRTASSAYDLTTLTATNDSTYNPFGNNTDGEYFEWASISPDGKHVILASEDANDVCRLRSFDLSTAYDLSTHENEKTAVIGATGKAWVNPNGYQIIQAEYVQESDTPFNIVLYTLKTAWDASSISKRIVLGAFGLEWNTSVNGLFTNPDGDKIFIVLSMNRYAVVDLSGGGE